MCSKLVLTGVLLVSLAHAREPKHYQTGELLRMESVECGYDENGGKGLTGQILGTDSEHKKTKALLCQEYVLQSDRVVYRIRPKDDKHPVLLPVGEKAQFRMVKDKMSLRVEDLDDKEREYFVISMTPREDSKTAESTPSKLNHLQ